MSGTGSVRRQRRVPGASIVLLLTAAAHAALGLHEGLLDGGDYGLLYVAAPMMALTVLAAGLTARGTPGTAAAGLGLTVVSLTTAIVLIPFYLLGLFHLPQAVVAVAVAGWAAVRARRSAQRR